MSPHVGLPVGRWRLALILALLGAGLFLVVAKAARLQLNLGPDLKELAERQYLRTLEFSAPRGNIYDRAGRPLAVSVPVWSVAASPRLVEDVAGAVKALAPVLSMDEDVLRRRLGTDRSFVWLRRRVTPELAEAVKQLDLEFISLHRESKRFYPGRELAGQLLGTVSIDGEGQSGVERAFDEHLRGRSVALPGLRDNKGRRVLLAQGIDLEVLEGDDIYLSIDASLQHVAEQALVKAVGELKAKSGFAVVVDPRTFAIRALANAPLFNPNAPGAGPKGARRNHAVSDVFEPGSTFKTVTFAAALEEDTVKLADRIFCENGRYKLGRFTVRDTHPEGWLSVRDVFKFSSNIGTLKIVQKLGEERFRKYVDLFGFGQPPGLGFVEESTGLLPARDRWGDIRLSTTSYGHGLSVTALQLASAVATVANDGVRLPLSIFERVQSPSGEIVREPPRREQVRVVSERTARSVAAVMTTVLEEGGTGHRAAIEGVQAAGKTGTAEKVDPTTGRYSKERHTSSFVGFAPVEDPQVVVVVVIDEPEGLTSGGATAGPVWKEIVTAALVDRGLLTAAQVGVEGGDKPDEVGKVGKAPPKGASARGGPSSGEAGAAHPEASADGSPPGFLGLSAREALRQAEARGLVIQLAGSGRVVREETLTKDDGTTRLVLHLEEAAR